MKEDQLTKNNGVQSDNVFDQLSKLDADWAMKSKK